MRTIFIGTPAFIGRIDGEARCAFWADEPVDHGFDRAKLIPIDMSRAPSAAISGQLEWSAVQVDDCYGGPDGNMMGTTIGSSLTELQIAGGGVYLAEPFWRSLPEALRPPCPPAGATAHAHEYQTVLYWPGTSDPRAGKRYAGHHAEIVEERGGLARVAVFPQGGSLRRGVKPAVMWIDLASPEQCDAGHDSLTRIGIGDRAKVGALFLILGSLQEA